MVIDNRRGEESALVGGGGVDWGGHHLAHRRGRLGEDGTGHLARRRGWLGESGLPDADGGGLVELDGAAEEEAALVLLLGGDAVLDRLEEDEADGRGLARLAVDVALEVDDLVAAEEGTKVINLDVLVEVGDHEDALARVLDAVLGLGLREHGGTRGVEGIVVLLLGKLEVLVLLREVDVLQAGNVEASGAREGSLRLEGHGRVLDVVEHGSGLNPVQDVPGKKNLLDVALSSQVGIHDGAMVGEVGSRLDLEGSKLRRIMVEEAIMVELEAGKDMRDTNTAAEEDLHVELVGSANSVADGVDHDEGGGLLARLSISLELDVLDDEAGEELKDVVNGGVPVNVGDEKNSVVGKLEVHLARVVHGAERHDVGLKMKA